MCKKEEKYAKPYICQALAGKQLIDIRSILTIELCVKTVKLMPGPENVAPHVVKPPTVHRRTLAVAGPQVRSSRKHLHRP